MQVDSSKLMSADTISPSNARYRVVFTHQHDTLRQGDIVKMVDMAGNNGNIFIRPDDTTAHAIHKDGQYVIVIRME
jgi:hypothetical protein